MLPDVPSRARKPGTVSEGQRDEADARDGEGEADDADKDNGEGYQDGDRENAQVEAVVLRKSKRQKVEQSAAQSPVVGKGGRGRRARGTAEKDIGSVNRRVLTRGRKNK